MPHAMCTPTIGVHMASRRARQACRACTPVWKACKACTPFGQACRLCTPVGSRYAKYPYKGTKGSRQPLDSRGLREPHDRDYVHRSSDCVAHVSLSNREAYVSQPRSVPLELTWVQVPKPATKHTNPSPRTAPPLNGPTTAVSPPQAPLLGKKGPPGPLFAQKKPTQGLVLVQKGPEGPLLDQHKASSDPQTPHQAQKGPAKPHLG
ncbi:hypothetical protein PCANC_05322 [Puccinia coronata f. sp. avenae]|uniref:Uncharacterized protein n=1 Tax=Puccinia coronata f. sp. avenae TaxID=200324 RepID=A0A2N5VXD5_9BASI|nr:hypothetical protein PCANC_05322 [Puccinia coronata f. sp. avenae]